MHGVVEVSPVLVWKRGSWTPRVGCSSVGWPGSSCSQENVASGSCDLRGRHSGMQWAGGDRRPLGGQGWGLGPPRRVYPFPRVPVLVSQALLSSPLLSPRVSLAGPAPVPDLLPPCRVSSLHQSTGGAVPALGWELRPPGPWQPGGIVPFVPWVQHWGQAGLLPWGRCPQHRPQHLLARDGCLGGDRGMAGGWQQSHRPPTRVPVGGRGLSSRGSAWDRGRAGAAPFRGCQQFRGAARRKRWRLGHGRCRRG